MEVTRREFLVFTGIAARDWLFLLSGLTLGR